jgi:hypothetical protein
LAHDHTLIQIRERSYLDLLDLALVVIRRRPQEIGLAALAGAVPFVLLNAWLTYQIDVPIPLYLYLLLLESAWATMPLTVVMGDMMFGGRPSARSVCRRLARGLPGLFFYQFLIRGILMAIGILYPLVPSRLGFVNEVVLLEQGKIRGVVKRCSNLTGDRGAEFFGQWLAQIMIGATFVILFWFGVGSLVNTLTTSKMTWDDPSVRQAYSLRFQLGIWLAITFFGVVRFLSYIDQRIRLEGWEVKLRLQALGRALAEAKS